MTALFCYIALAVIILDILAGNSAAADAVIERHMRDTRDVTGRLTPDKMLCGGIF